MADFIDFFVLGDGEDVIVEIVARAARAWESRDRKAALRRFAQIPAFMCQPVQAEYEPDGRFKRLIPTVPRPLSVSRGGSLPNYRPSDAAYCPFIEVVHDRGAVEIHAAALTAAASGQAGMIYRPVRNARWKNG